jgi:hypothetical protein
VNAVRWLQADRLGVSDDGVYGPATRQAMLWPGYWRDPDDGAVDFGMCYNPPFQSPERLLTLASMPEVSVDVCLSIRAVVAARSPSRLGCPPGPASAHAADPGDTIVFPVRDALATLPVQEEPRPPGPARRIPGLRRLHLERTGTHRAYANGLDDARALFAVSATSNRSKTDQDPATWQPPADGHRCTRHRREYFPLWSDSCAHVRTAAPHRPRAEAVPRPDHGTYHPDSARKAPGPARFPPALAEQAPLPKPVAGLAGHPADTVRAAQGSRKHARRSDSGAASSRRPK